MTTATGKQFRLYTLGNDRVIDDLKGLIGSARHFNPDLPIYVIAYDENIKLTKTLCDANNIPFLDQNLEKFDDLGRGFSRQFEKGMKIFRKFQAFSEHSDCFLFLDADCLVLNNLDPLFQAFTASNGEICFYAHSGPNRNFSSPAMKQAAERLLGHPEGLNAAFFMSYGNMLPLALLQALASRMMRLEQLHGVKHEQAFLNYCALVMGLQVTMMRTLAPQQNPPWDLNCRIVQTETGYRFENTRQPPISVLHYSSPHWRDGVNAPLYRHFAALAEKPVQADQ